MTLDWAREQNDGLRVALERESGTAKLEEAVAVYREALKEWTREGARAIGPWPSTTSALRY